METAWIYGFIGGCLIGAASLLAMIVTRKVPGISGVFGKLLRPGTPDRLWRLVFTLGLIAGATALFFLSDHASLFRAPEGRSLIVFGVAGLLVGFGTRLGGGCTSGHGVCGSGMGARDSMVATVTFMIAGFVTVYLCRFLLAGS